MERTVMIKDKELISVVIPAYNIEQYIGHCLDSILNQTYKKIEIVAVDDGSTDQTPAILEEYAIKDERVHVIHKENGGVTSARLRGVTEATGNWIGFVDGDDWIEPEMYERLYKNAIQNHSQISHCGYQMVFPDRIDYYYNSGEVIIQKGHEAVKQLLKGEFEPGLCNKLFGRELFDDLLKNDRVDLKIRINEDLLMNYYLFREAKMVIFDDFCPYHYQVRKGSAANSRLRAYKLRDAEIVRRTILADTIGDITLYPLALQILTSHLVRTSTMSVNRKDTDVREYILEARAGLQELLPEIRKWAKATPKIFFFSHWAVIWPASFRWIRNIHGEITGARHKYDIK